MDGEGIDLEKESKEEDGKSGWGRTNADGGEVWKKQSLFEGGTKARIDGRKLGGLKVKREKKRKKKCDGNTSLCFFGSVEE